MGRQLRRVALDFNWPHNKVWKGFINPHYDKCHNCEACAATGYSPEAYKVYQQWYGYIPFDPASTGSRPWTPEDAPIRVFAERNVKGAPLICGSGEAAILREARRLCGLWNNQLSHHLSQAHVDALVANGRLMDLTHTWSKEDGWQPKVPAYHPTAAEVNAWSLQSFGHDSTNQWVVTKAVCEGLGVSTSCPVCDGEGSTWDSPEAKKIAEEWKQEEPPAGPGYQLWETVSEGSPISPVFEKPEDLAHWLVDNPHGIDKGTSFEQWMTFICGDGWAPSMVLSNGVVLSGVAATGL